MSTPANSVLAAPAIVSVAVLAPLVTFTPAVPPPAREPIVSLSSSKNCAKVVLAITTAPESEIALPLEIRKAPDSVIFVWPVYELEPVRVKKLPPFTVTVPVPVAILELMVTGPYAVRF